MTAGDTVKAPAVFFEQFSELFTGHGRLYAAYMMYVKREKADNRISVSPLKEEVPDWESVGLVI